MPLQINVGLNRKASKDYQSTGVSINIQAELDATLLARPDELQRQVADLYAQAEAALDRQVGQSERATAPQAARQALPAARQSSAAPVPRTGYGAPRQPSAPAQPQRWDRSTATAGRVDGNPQPAATESQLKAIRAIAQSMGVDPDAEAEALGFKFPISRGNASRFIDHLKGMQAPQRAAA